jgi:multidrug transporter EmrE-like cation transporter
MVINAWVLLIGAIVLEVVSTSLLNASQGMRRWGYGAAAMIGYGLCFWLLAFAMTRIPMGVVYALWSGLGIAAITVIGWVVFRQHLTLAQGGFITLIVIGAIGLNLTTVRAAG